VASGWADFEAAEPEVAELGRAALYQYGPGLGFLATVRADGGPRMHPVCPAVVDGRLWVLVGDSPKRRDLERDPRYALHSFPKPDVDDEFYVTGTARREPTPDLDAQVRAHMKDLGVNTGDPDELYEFLIDRAMFSKYGPRPSWPPEYKIWRAPT
jgi:pyridoxamine 5'-phosphate oxidase-like protein